MHPCTCYAAIVGAVLAELRKSSGKQQRDVARSLGLRQSAWSKIERGEVSLNIEQLAAVAGFFATKPSVILERADHVAEHAEKLGVKVRSRRSVQPIEGNLITIGAPAVAEIVAQVFNQPLSEVRA